MIPILLFTISTVHLPSLANFSVVPLKLSLCVLYVSCITVDILPLYKIILFGRKSWIAKMDGEDEPTLPEKIKSNDVNEDGDIDAPYIDVS